MTEENHEKTPVSVVGTGIRTRDLPNASLVRYHGATSLGLFIYYFRQSKTTPELKPRLFFSGMSYIKNI